MLEVSADVGEGSVRARTSKKRTKSKRRTSPAFAPVTPPASDATAAGMAVAVVVGTIVVGALALTAYPSRPVAAVATNPQPHAVAPPVLRSAAVGKETRAVSLVPPQAFVEESPAPRAIVEKPRPTPVSSKIVWPPASLRSSPPAVATASAATGSASLETAAVERTVSASAPPPSDSGSQDVTTMTGCLEVAVEGDEFRLTDIEGAGAPKARSWRSGFLKKRAAPVELVELPDRDGLRKYVGHRVVATGLLTGRELRVRSFQSAGSSCE
jgi:hypothetical protein